MRLIQAPLLAGILVLATASAPAQDTRSGVQGVLRSDGTFRPFVLRAITSGTTGTETIGEFTAAISFKVVSQITLVQYQSIECTLTATAEGESSTGLIDDFVESITIPAKISGSNGTCSPALPYRWLLNGAQDRVNISYSVSVPSTATEQPSISGPGSPTISRSTQGSLTTIPMPANDSITRFSVITRI